MTKQEALKKWNQAATISLDGVRLDNWRPITHVLRHFADSDKIQETSPGVIVAMRTVVEDDKSREVSLSLAVS